MFLMMRSAAARRASAVTLRADTTIHSPDLVKPNSARALRLAGRCTSVFVPGFMVCRSGISSIDDNTRLVFLSWPASPETAMPDLGSYRQQ